MSEEVFGVFAQQAAIAGRFDRNTRLTLTWLPQYIEEFPQIISGVPLKWNSCKFVKGAQINVPEQFGVYCFAVDLGPPFPEPMHLPLYVGKAADQYLCERYEDYLQEKGDAKGRKKVVFMLNKYKNRLTFWWVEMPLVYVETVERHLQMCCEPPCNERIPSREKFWGRAFDLVPKGDE